MSNRFCNSCKNTKPIEAFPLDKTRKDGIHSYCKACANERAKRYYLRLKNTPEYRQRRRESQLKYRSQHQTKVKAHHLAKNIPLPDICVRCENSPAKHRHHPDYTKPLEIIGLCITCHEIEHHGALR